VAVLTAIVLGCGYSEQRGSGERETPSEQPTTSEPASPPPTQPATRSTPVPPERHEGLKVGEPAEFKNGLIVTVEGATLMQPPVALSERLKPDDYLVAVRFRAENANLEGQTPSHTFNITTALWQALDQDGNALQTLYPLETSLVAGELPNPSPDYPYLGWQGELRRGQERQGSMLFAAPLSAQMRVIFTQPVMGPPPLGKWELGTVSGLPRAP
jgi:hypothetical protein